MSRSVEASREGFKTRSRSTSTRGGARNSPDKGRARITTADCPSVLLVCDLDGTLVDNDAAYLRWAHRLAAEHDQGVDFVDWMIAERAAGAIERRELYPALRSRLQLRESLAEARAAFDRALCAEFRCVDGATAALRTVRARGHQIAVVTNGSPMQADKIRAAGIDGLVDAVCISSVDGVAKPDPRIVALAAHRAGASLDGAWMIGDMPADIQAADAAGIRSVWLDRNRGWTESAFGPTLLAPSFSDAVAFVLGAWASSPR